MRRLFFILLCFISLTGNCYSQSCGCFNPGPASSNLIIAMFGQSNDGNTRYTSDLASTAYSSYPGTYSNVHYVDSGCLACTPVASNYTTRAVYARASGSVPFGADLGLVKNISGSTGSVEIIKAFFYGTPLKNIGNYGNPNCFYPNVPGGYFYSLFYKSDGSSFTQGKLANINYTRPNAFIWIQGETDASNNYTTYAQDLIDFVQALRDGYHDQTIPFFYNELHAHYDEIAGVAQHPVGRAAVRAGQESFQSSKNIMINMDDVTMNDPDGVNIHYDAAGLAEMGKRFATAIKTYYSLP